MSGGEEDKSKSTTVIIIRVGMTSTCNPNSGREGTDFKKTALPGVHMQHRDIRLHPTQH